MEPRWKVISDFPNYAVSDDGQVKRLTTRNSARAGALLSQFLVSGYPSVNLVRPGFRTSVRVHRLVAEAFLEMVPGATEVNHIDADRANNHHSNLEWVTASGNRFHAYVKGGLRADGENNGYSKLTNDVVHQIRGTDEDSRAVAQRFNVSVATIRDVRARRTWAHI